MVRDYREAVFIQKGISESGQPNLFLSDQFQGDSFSGGVDINHLHFYSLAE